MGPLGERGNRIKYVLFAFNIVFMITGIILIAIGDNVFTAFMEYHLFLISYFFWIPILLVVIGSIVIAISLFGCCGAFKESHHLITTLSVLLFLIFMLELLAGIGGYILTSDASLLIRNSLNDSIKEYNSTHPNDKTAYWDYLQKTFTCCGIESYQDWYPYFKDELPLSCCYLPIGFVGNFNCTGSNLDINLYNSGCFNYFSNYITAKVLYLAEAGIIIATLQFFGVIFACYVAREIKNRNDMTESIS